MTSGSYVAERDEVAFEALLRRHGPMILGYVGPFKESS
jgi:hypothetical protein